MRAQPQGTGPATAAAIVGVIALLMVIRSIGGLVGLPLDMAAIVSAGVATTHPAEPIGALTLGVAAIMLGGAARGRVNRGTADPRGAGRARLGSVLGWITTALSLLVIVYYTGLENAWR